MGLVVSELHRAKPREDYDQSIAGDERAMAVVRELLSSSAIMPVT
jgi:hypothetical protein